MTIKTLTLLHVACFFALTTFAQHDDHDNHETHLPGEFCGKNYMTEVFFQSHPGAREEAEKEQKALEKFTAEFVASENRSGQTLVIPVVFHVIHAGGEENISDAQVASAIDALNEDFSASNPELSDVQPAFQGVIGDVDIEFRAARLDPQGNCTNGVVRAQSSQTFDGGFGLLDVSPIWPRNRYMNVYVCAAIEGNTIGFTLIPSSVNGGQGADIDAIYITHSYVGRIGTSNQQRSHTLSHEVGHWLNLEHLWGPSNSPGVSSNCNTDDQVGDTPNTIGWTSCNLSGSTCGSLDNVENMMEYSSCSKHFTAGQASRMRAALNSSTAQRNQLSTVSNLTITGVNQPEEICLADFERADGVGAICPGDEVTFNDLSYNGVTARSWTFEGAQPSVSSEQNPTVSFSEPGTYSVSLTVTNPLGEMSVTKNEIVTVVPSGQNPIPYTESFEAFGGELNMEENWFVSNPDGNQTREWEVAENAGYSGNNSIFVNGRFNADGAEEHVETPTIDLSSVSPSAVFTFKYAHARRNGASNDRLVISVTRNCGTLWNTFLTIGIDDLPTVGGNFTGPFVPSGPGDWTEVSVPNIVAVLLNEEFKARFEFTSFRGNNIYIDDINIFDPLTVSTDDDVSIAEGVNIYPNPAADQFTLEYRVSEPGRVTAEVIDISGRTLDALFSADRAPGKYIASYNIDHLAPGVYFIRLTANGEGAVKKLAVR